MRELIHIYGPFSIYSYGVAIACGILVLMWFIQRDPRFKKLNLEKHFTTIVVIGVTASFFGARFLEIMTQPSIGWSSFFNFWEGGLSVLGGMPALLIAVIICLQVFNIPILPCLDLGATYAGIAQAFGRIGCFFAGCCYGLPTQLGWAICYTDSNTSAPIGIWMHPTQLYSSILLFFIFLLMYFVLQYKFTIPGQLTSIYFMLASTERFLVDFWRSDRLFFASPSLSFLSINQFIAFGIFGLAALAFTYVSIQPQRS